MAIGIATGAPSRRARVRASAGRTARRRVPHRRRPAPSLDVRPIDVEAIAAGWQRAFEAAGSALRAAGASLPAGEIQGRRVALAREIARTEVALQALDARRESGLRLCG